MKAFDVQTVEINAPFNQVFEYIANARKLPEWTNAFKSISDGHAVMETPKGSVEVQLKVHGVPSQGTIDWTITFPDGSVAKAYSRVIATDSERSLYRNS